MAPQAQCIKLVTGFLPLQGGGKSRSVRREGRKGAVGRREKHADENLHAVSGSLGQKAFLERNRRRLPHDLGEGLPTPWNGRSSGAWRTGTCPTCNPSEWTRFSGSEVTSTSRSFTRSTPNANACCGWERTEPSKPCCAFSGRLARNGRLSCSSSAAICGNPTSRSLPRKPARPSMSWTAFTSPCI